MSVSQPEIRAAKKFLKSKGLDDYISPKQFALSAKELDCSFRNTLHYLDESEDVDDRREDSG
jgi:hypothetical protein